MVVSQVFCLSLKVFHKVPFLLLYYFSFFINDIYGFTVSEVGKTQAMAGDTIISWRDHEL
jgi:hypothetical protein